MEARSELKKIEREETLVKTLGVLVVLVLALLTWNGYNIREQNRALLRECDDHGHVYRTKWDGGTLLAVRCNDDRRFKR